MSHNTSEYVDPNYSGRKKISYTVNTEGKVVPTKSSGWEVEAIATQLAWEKINHEIEQARQDVLIGRKSPILYYMKKRMMDIGLLAQCMNFFRLSVWLHLQPIIFKRLSQRTIQKYANCFSVSVEELITLQESEKK